MGLVIMMRRPPIDIVYHFPIQFMTVCVHWFTFESKKLQNFVKLKCVIWVCESNLKVLQTP